MDRRKLYTRIIAALLAVFMMFGTSASPLLSGAFDEAAAEDNFAAAFNDDGLGLFDDKTPCDDCGQHGCDCNSSQVPNTACGDCGSYDCGGDCNGSQVPPFTCGDCSENGCAGDCTNCDENCGCEGCTDCGEDCDCENCQTDEQVTADAYIITTFTPLAAHIANQTVAFETPLADLNLPGILNAAVYDGKNEFDYKITGVTWRLTSVPVYECCCDEGNPPGQPAPEDMIYEGFAGTYEFTAVLPLMENGEKYGLAGGVNLPVITVEVEPLGFAETSINFTAATLEQLLNHITFVNVNHANGTPVTITLTAPITIPGGSGPNATFTRLEGAVNTNITILRGAGVTGNLFTVGNFAHLLILRIAVDGNGGIVTNAASLISINGEAAALTLNAGAVLQNNRSITAPAVRVQNGTMTINNQALITGNVTGADGNILLQNTGIINMNGGAITGNNAARGGGIFVQAGGTLRVGGTSQINENTRGSAATITDNIHLDNNAYLTMGIGEFQQPGIPLAGMSIGITKTANTGIFVQSNGTTAHTAYFFADNGTFIAHTGGQLRVSATPQVLTPADRLYLAAAGETIPYGSDWNAATRTFTLQNNFTGTGELTSQLDIFEDFILNLNGYNLRINVPAAPVPEASGIRIHNNSILTIMDANPGASNLLETSTAAGGAGIQSTAGTLIIESGRVTAQGGTSGAGIGGANSQNSGTVIINGGIINAQGGALQCAGIGQGRNGGGTGGSILITGGTVTATGSPAGNASGIGNAVRDNVLPTIIISGGNVTATGSGSAAGIGGRGGCGGNILIYGENTVVRATGGNADAQHIGRGSINPTAGQVFAMLPAGNLRTGATAPGTVLGNPVTFSATPAVNLRAGVLLPAPFGQIEGVTPNLSSARSMSLFTNFALRSVAFTLGGHGSITRTGHELATVGTAVSFLQSSIVYVHATKASIPDGSFEQPFSSVQDAYNAIPVGMAGEIRVLSNLTMNTLITTVISENKNVTISSFEDSGTGDTPRINAPWVITRGINGSLFTLGTNANLFLENIIIDGNHLESNHHLVRVENNARLTIRDGAELRNGNMSTGDSGAAVRVSSGGIFDMYGGELSGNSSVNSGGGVAVISGGTMNMYGGLIRDNAANQGGGIFAGGTVNIRGGTIINNRSNQGGGVHVAATTGVLNVGGNALISGNMPSTGTAANNVFLANNRMITLITGLHAPIQGMNVGIQTQTASGIFVQNGASTANMAQFTPDLPNLHVELNGAGLRLVTPQVIYVRNNGNNANAGTFAAPKLTLQGAYDAIPVGGAGEIRVLSNLDVTMGGVSGSATGLRIENKSIIINSYNNATNVPLTTGTAHSIRRNRVPDALGSMFILGSAASSFASLTLENIIIDGNAPLANMIGPIGGMQSSCVLAILGANSSNAVLTLNNRATLRNNNIDTSAGSNGAAVSMQSNATLIMNTGSLITECSWRFTDGGAVNVSGGTFHMNGGTISNNRAGRAGESTTGNGGGVLASGGTFNMNGGSITGNHANGRGGGVHVSGNGTFNMNGGSITGNTAGNGNNTGTVGLQLGGGVAVTSGTLRLGGNAVIQNNTNTATFVPSTRDNVFLSTDQYITLGTGTHGVSAPAAGMTVGVNKTANSGIFVQNGATTAHMPRFFGDRDPLVVVQDDDRLQLMHVVYVSNTGDDVFGNGTFANPFATLNRANLLVLESGVADIRVLSNLNSPSTTQNFSGNKTITIRSFDAATGQTPQTGNNRHTITRASGRATADYDIQSGTALIFRNIILDGHPTSSNSHVFSNSGMIRMQTGAVLQNNGNGGIWNNAAGIVHLEGGTITGTSAGNTNGFAINGPGIVQISSGSEINMTGNIFGGSPRNIRLDTGSTINILSQPAAGSKIGITTAAIPTPANPVTFATGINTAGGDEAFWRSVFIPDRDGELIKRDGDVLRLFVLTPITTAEITVTTPVTGNVPNNTANGGTNFTRSAVTWTPAHNPFRGDEQYTAEVTLTANDGYIFTSLSTATINGQTAAVTNNTGSQVTLSYQFPATDLATFNLVTAPAVSAIDIYGGLLNTSAFTNHGTVTGQTGGAVAGTWSWSPAANAGATIPRYTLNGTPANNYTAVFTPTDPADQTGYNVLTVEMPVTVTNRRQLTIGNPSGSPTKIYDGNTSYTGTGINIGTLTNIVGSDDVAVSINSTVFNQSTVLLADTITIVYAISGDNAGNYTAPANGTIAAAITPQTLAAPASADLNQNGTVTFAPGANNAAAGSSYRFTLYNGTTAVTGFENISVTSDTIPTGIVAKMLEAAGVYTIKVTANTTNTNYTAASAESAASNAVNVYSVAVTITDGNGTDNVNGNTVSYTEYAFGGTTVTLTATPASGRRVSWGGAGSGTENTRTITAIAANASVTADFTATEVSGIAVTTQPSNLTYAHGDTLSLAGLTVTLTYNNGTTKIVELADFPAENITTSPAAGTVLSLIGHNSNPITVIFNNSMTIRANTDNLTVNAGTLTAATGTPTASAIPIYGGLLSSSTLSGTVTNQNGAEVAGSWIWISSANAGTTIPKYTANGTPANTYTAVFVPTNTADQTGYGEITAAVPVTVTNRRQLTIGTPSGSPTKIYDGNTSYTGTGVNIGALTNIAGSDDVNVSVNSAIFNQSTVPLANTITIVYAISGNDAANYTAPANGTIAGTITRITLTPSIDFTNVNGKIFDGNTNITGNQPTITLTGSIVSGETPTATATITYANENAGTNKNINATSIALDGTWGDNYVLSATTLTNAASTLAITRKDISIATITALTKTYDANLTATAGAVTFNGEIAGQALVLNTDYTVSAVFDAGNADTGTGNRHYTYTVTMQDTTRANNYNLTASTMGGTNGTINPANLTGAPAINIDDGSGGNVLKIGAELTASGTFNTSVTYEWFVGGLSAGTGVNYTVEGADAGKTITVTAIPDNNNFIGMLTSSATAVIPYTITVNAPAGNVTGDAITFNTETAPLTFYLLANDTISISYTVARTDRFNTLTLGNGIANINAPYGVNATPHTGMVTYTVAASNAVSGVITFNPQFNHNSELFNAEVLAAAPVKGGNPLAAPAYTTVTETNYYTGLITWNGDLTTTGIGGRFAGGEVYTAAIILSAVDPILFHADFVPTVFGTTVDNIVVAPDGKTVSFTAAFTTLPAKVVTAIEVITQPAALTYTHGEALNLDGLVAALIYDDTSVLDVAFTAFAANNITATPASGTALSRATHNNTTIAVTYNNSSITAPTNNLVLNRADNTLVISQDDITFGIAPNPQVTTNISNSAVTFEYKLQSAADSTYSSTVPSALGSYTVRATSAETTNHNPAAAAVNFNLAPAPLTGKPVISASGGLLIQNAILTANTTSLNAHGDIGTTFSYQWKADGQNIGTDSNQYTMQYSDVGKAIMVTVTASGNFTGPAESDPTGSKQSGVISINDAPPTTAGGLSSLFENQDVFCDTYDMLVINTGGSVVIKLRVEKLDSPGAAVQEDIEKAAAGQNIGLFLNLSVIKYHLDKDKNPINGPPVTVPYLFGDTIAITVELPPAIRGLAPYTIFHADSITGDVESIPAVYNPQLHTLTFEAGAFSNFAIAYTPAVIASGGSGSGNSGGSGDNELIPAVIMPEVPYFVSEPVIPAIPGATGLAAIGATGRGTVPNFSFTEEAVNSRPARISAADSPYRTIPLSQMGNAGIYQRPIPSITVAGRTILLFAPMGAEAWSLLNLVFGCIIGILLAVIIALRALIKKRRELKEVLDFHNITEGKSYSQVWLTVAIGMGIAGAFLFVLIQDMGKLMVALDMWTITHMVIIASQAAAIMVILKRDKKEKAKAQAAVNNQLSIAA
ncbi:MAG: YDG domain-containing protein [Lachnospiraceae bacterium]|nr:YDG domain-containing protein [Lachnospiraceae bacterium]